MEDLVTTVIVEVRIQLAILLLRSFYKMLDNTENEA